ncbi:hypothetical protein BCR33DRAFT_712661 [Rhizoclosmatium globosum]|uniref:Uncharacterized protein n=1 Tax=Rhizoclosmatium globosum TaxID=329046 RepID=A0A1Y2CX88_9FUNG|nr:hypothetical protein BCR33DRAFT_712661 [Rhizoclosmatium globosum]|eukprot:ORY51643.1 hypothetical protein BCR33DRAFT_712661 [Rhizoclosmatium globosum]
MITPHPTPFIPPAHQSFPLPINATETIPSIQGTTPIVYIDRTSLWMGIGSGVFVLALYLVVICCTQWRKLLSGSSAPAELDECEKRLARLVLLRKEAREGDGYLASV